MEPMTFQKFDAGSCECTRGRGGCVDFVLLFLFVYPFTQGTVFVKNKAVSVTLFEFEEVLEHNAPMFAVVGCHGECDDDGWEFQFYEVFYYVVVLEIVMDVP